jgi:hypothetical protein
MAKKKSKRTIVGSPLTPAILKELGAIRKPLSTPDDFKPDGNWVNTYRIWTCHGYRESGNHDVGFIRLSRIGNSDKIFELNVHREVVQTDGIINIIEGTIKCRNNQLASPIQWKLSSRFRNADGKHIKELSKENSRNIEVTDKTTGDWCLFEAVQRLAFDKQISLSFDLLEGMSLKKLRHRFFYRGTKSIKMDSADKLLHCFVQLGSGILPYEYWLDAHHRLIAVTSMNKAYILDDQAEKAIR